jgi:hypothetical protein
MRITPVKTLDGDTVELRIEAPRQSACLDYMAEIADLDATALREHHAAALGFLSRLVSADGIEDVPAWFDASVGFDVLVTLAGEVLASRMPKPATQKKPKKARA